MTGNNQMSHKNPMARMLPGVIFIRFFEDKVYTLLLIEF